MAKKTKPSKSSTANGKAASSKAAEPHSDISAVGVLTSIPSSRDLKIEQFSLSFHGRQLIIDSSIELNHGRRYGLIGANGSGKSTLLHALYLKMVPIPDHVDVYLLNEEAPPLDMTGLEYIVSEAEAELHRLEQVAERILERDPQALELDDVYDKIERLDANTFEVRAALLLNGLGFDKEKMAKATRDLSGGWRMRVALAKALFVRPQVLLLDQPTNHLDLGACVWLEEYLKTYDQILVMVSHSQDFLNGVCTNIMDLNHLKKLVYYGGNYDAYVKTKREQEINQNKAYDKQQNEIAHIKKFVASAGTYSNLVKQAKSKLKIIDKTEAAGLVEKVEAPPLFKFKFVEVDKLPPPVLAFDDVGFAYSGKLSECLYRHLNLGVDMDSRIALVGPNGAGKSTLLKLITGELTPTEGRINKHMGVKFAKYSQHSNDQLDMDKSPIEYMQAKFGSTLGTEVDFWRQQIGRYGLSGSHQTGQISTLSDGLKSRLVFAELALSKPHILLFDEPTNHLDMESIDSLANAIKEYQGGMLLVSHDFRLISQVAEEIWLCEHGTIKKLDMDITEYKEMLKKQVKLS